MSPSLCVSLSRVDDKKCEEAEMLGGGEEGMGDSRLRYMVCLYTVLGLVHSRYICQNVYSISICRHCETTENKSAR